ncbi:hypothetical protein [Halalkalicoccus tibetensis]|uniref:Uncharacterized protein n=1 Tax=Halalkalicoccus tibetensis TaxID=175632 RepID=A0ABD5V6R5_9EURY
MEREKELIIQHITDEIVDKTEISESDLRLDIERIVDNAINVNKSTPIEHVMTKPSRSSSRKPRNINIELDISDAFNLLAESSILQSESPEIIMGTTLGLLCSTVAEKAKVTLSDEAGFVYWVAYENHDLWEIPKRELITKSVEKTDNIRARIHLNEQKTTDAIDELIRKECITIEENGQDPIILRLRERCTSNWQ